MGSMPNVSGNCGSTGTQPTPLMSTSAQLWLAKPRWLGGMYTPHTGLRGTPAARHRATSRRA